MTYTVHYSIVTRRSPGYVLVVFLIITVLSIVLVGAVTLATLYYGGSAYDRTADVAKANQLLNQARQLEAAARTYFDDRGSWPSDLQQLVDLQYLRGVPATGAVAWTTAVAGQPVYYIASGDTSLPICAEYNRRASLQLPAVPSAAYADLPSQCYGPQGGLVVVLNAGGDSIASAALAALPAPTEGPGSLPNPGYTEGWTQPPSGAMPGSPPAPAPLAWYTEGLPLSRAVYFGGASISPNGFHLINRGAIQAGAADFEIQGPDAAHFKIIAVSLMTPYSAASDGTDIACGAQVTPQRWTGCVAEDPSVGPHTDFRVVVRFEPLSVGTFTADLAAISTNGRTDLPAPLGPLEVTGCATGAPTCP